MYCVCVTNSAPSNGSVFFDTGRDDHQLTCCRIDESGHNGVILRRLRVRLRKIHHPFLSGIVLSALNSAFLNSVHGTKSEAVVLEI